MAFVSVHEVNKAIIAGLTADAAVTALLGSAPLRVFTHPRASATMPFARLDTTPNAPVDGVMRGSPDQVFWLRRMNVQLTAFSLQTSLDNVAAIQAALANAMDKANTFTVTGGAIVMSMPGVSFCDYDENEESSIAVLEYTLTTQST